MLKQVYLLSELHFNPCL